MSENKYIICPVCGQENKIVNDLCEGCGGKLEGGVVKIIAASEIVNELKSNSDNAKTRTKKENKKSKPVFKKTSSMKFTGSKLVYLILALVLVGVVNLFVAGVFDSPDYIAPNEQKNLSDLQQGTDLSKLQEINNLEKVVENNPADFKSLLSLAHLLNDSGFYDKAVNKYQDYLKLRPNEPDVIVDLGVCYYQLNDFNNAITTMKKALQINPEHQIANFNIGIVSFAAGNKNEAVSWWKKAVEIDPNTNIAKKAEELINTHQ